MTASTVDGEEVPKGFPDKTSLPITSDAKGFGVSDEVNAEVMSVTTCGGHEHSALRAAVQPI